MLANAPISNMEPVKLTSYTAGQKFGNHIDPLKYHIDPHTNQKTTSHCTIENSNRIMTMIVYLNDCGEGGGTHFTSLPCDRKLKYEAGEKVLYYARSLVSC